MDSIDHRMQSFVAWRGEVPSAAERLEDFDARKHAATWIRHNIGKGVAGVYVIGYALEVRWWSYFFERVDRCAPDGAEVWSIEAYNHEGTVVLRNATCARGRKLRPERNGLARVGSRA